MRLGGLCLFGSSFTTHCPKPMWTSNPEASGKFGRTTLGEGDSLDLHPFFEVFQQGDTSTGLYADPKNVLF